MGGRGSWIWDTLASFFFPCSGKMIRIVSRGQKGAWEIQITGGKEKWVEEKCCMEGHFYRGIVEIMGQFRRKYRIKFEDRVSPSRDVCHLVPLKKKEKEKKKRFRLCLFIKNPNCTRETAAGLAVSDHPSLFFSLVRQIPSPSGFSRIKSVQFTAARKRGF